MTFTQKLRFLLDSEATPPEPVGSYNGFTLADWSTSSTHVNWARQMMHEPRFRDMLAVLSNARPQTTLRGITDTEAAIALGRRIGYDEAFAIIMALTRSPEREPEVIEPDYGASEARL